MKGKKTKRYSSFKGDITPAPANLITRDFHADKPKKKWLTDITEFSISAGKVYLSLLMDCFDGIPVYWTIGTSPNAALVNGILEKAIERHCAKGSARYCTLTEAAITAHPEWIKMTEENGITRSMSKTKKAVPPTTCQLNQSRLNSLKRCTLRINHSQV